MSLKFDILQTPPSAEALALARESASRRIAQKNALEQRLNRVGYALLALGAVLLIWIAHLGWVSEGLWFSIVGYWVFFLCFFVLVSAHLHGIPIFFPPWPISIGLSFFVSAILSLAWNSVFGVITAMLVVDGMNRLYRRGIFWPRAEAQNNSDSLVELNASTLGGACIDYMTYVDQYPEIRSYQNAVLALGRKPVVGEYDAAKIWVDLFESRAREQAKSDLEQKACRRMTDAAFKQILSS